MAFASARHANDVEQLILFSGSDNTLGYEHGMILD